MNSEDIDWKTFRERVERLYEDEVRPFAWTIECKLVKQMGPYVTDWWGLFVIRLQLKEDTTESPFVFSTLEVLLEKEKDNSLTEGLQFVDITSGPGIDEFPFLYIDKMSFAYIEVAALGDYSGFIHRPFQETRNARVPVGGVVIAECFNNREQDMEILYFRAYHNGLVPITKDEATRILTSQLIESVRHRNQFPSNKIVRPGKVNRDGSIEVIISGMPESIPDENDYVKVKGKWVYRFKDQYTFHLSISPDTLDERTRILFEEFIGENT